MGQSDDERSSDERGSLKFVRGLAVLLVAMVVAGACAPLAPPRPPAPVGLSAEAGNGSATLTWTKKRGVTYRVQHSYDPDGSYSELARRLATASFTATGLENDVTSWFRVVAVDALGNRSAPSTPVSVVPGTVPLPPSATAIAQPDEALTISAGPFSATVPIGTVETPTPVTVTPLPDIEGELPAVDVHIHGRWSPDAGGVAITLPFPFPGNLSPIVFHDAADGTTVFSGDHVEVAGAGTARTVSVVTRSLSPSAAAPVDCAEGEFQLVQLCIDSDAKPGETVRGVLEDRMRAIQAQAEAGRPCDEVDGNLAAVGMTSSSISCTALDPASGLFSFVNDSNSWFVGNLPYVVNVNTSDAPAAVSVDNTSVLWFLRAFADQAGGTVVYPGAKAYVVKPTDPHETRVDWSNNQARSMFLNWLLAITTTGGDVALDAGNVNSATVNAMAACASEDIDATVLDCTRDVMRTAVGSILEEAARRAGKSFVKAVAVGARKFLFAIDVGYVFQAFGGALVPEHDTTYLINSVPVERPNSDTRTMWIARNPRNGRSVVVDGNSVRPIVDGGTFNCLAEVLTVWSISNLRVLREINDARPATCHTGPYALWDVRPEGNVGRNVILRNGDGSTWLINNAGAIQTIPDGGTFECLAASNPVIWNVDQQAIEDWEPVGTSEATCGLGPGDGSEILVGQKALLRSTPSGLGPECSDGINNDGVALGLGAGQDLLVDFPADPQCASASDDSETAPGVQPKLTSSIVGRVNSNGAVAISPAQACCPGQPGIFFPPAYHFLSGGVVTATFVPVGTPSGSFDPSTGQVTTNVSLRIRLQGTASGFDLGSNCYIGGIGGFPLQFSGTYSAEDGTGVLVTDSYAVPAASGCGPIGLANSVINGAIGLPSAAGNNSIVFRGALRLDEQP